MNNKELLELLDEYGDSHTIPHAAARRIRQLESILTALKGYILSDGLQNDRGAYFFHLIEWGQGLSEKPIPEEYGQD